MKKSVFNKPRIPSAVEGCFQWPGAGTGASSGVVSCAGTLEWWWYASAGPNEGVPVLVRLGPKGTVTAGA